MTTRTCIFPECKTEKVYARGICTAHYNLMQKVVYKKTRTWEDFEKAGYCLISKRGKTTEQSRQFYKLIEKMK